MQQAVKLWAGRIIGNPITDISAINDITFMKNLLSLLEPEYFRFTRFTNFEQILQKITEYYRSIHRMDASHKTKALKVKKDSIGLWQLFLGIAIKCPQRNIYIKMILELDEDARIALMNFINMITEDCPQIGGNESRIEDGKDQKLEKALIATIDELTEENTILKEKIDSMADSYENEKQEMTVRIDQLKETITGYDEERAEIFDACESQYVSDSLIAVFKTIQEQRNQLRSVLENREAVIANFEASSEQLAREFNKLKEQNKQMKKQYSQYRAMEKKLEDMDLELLELKNNEKKYLDQIYKLEEKLIRNSRQTTKKSLAEETRIQDTQWQPKEPQTKNVPVEDQDTGTRTLSEIFQAEVMPTIEQDQRPPARASIRNQLKPLLKDQNNVSKVRELQRQINTLNEKIIQLEGEIEYHRRETSERDNKIEGLQSKIVSVQRLNKLYADTIHERDEVAANKEHDYQGKYSALMEQIQQLKVQEQNIIQSMQSSSKQSEADKSQLKDDYNRQVEKVSDMLQQQLLQFKQRQLDYLQTIRKLNAKLNKQEVADGKSQQIQRGESYGQNMADPLTVSSMFVPEIGQLIHQSGVSQVTRDAPPKQVAQDVASTEVTHDGVFTQATHDTQLQSAVNEARTKCLILQQVISKLETKLTESVERETQLLCQLESVNKTVQHQQHKIEEYRQTILEKMQQILQSARTHKTTETTQHEPINIQSERIQQLIDDIQNIRQQSFQQLDSILKQHRQQQRQQPKQSIVQPNDAQTKIREYITSTQLNHPSVDYSVILEQSAKRLQSLKQSIILIVSDNKEQPIDNTMLQSLETHYKQFEQTIKSKDNIIELLNKRLVDANNRLCQLQNDNTLMAASREQLISKIAFQTALTSELQCRQQHWSLNDTGEFVQEMSKLVDQVTTLKNTCSVQASNTQELEARIVQLLQDNQQLVLKIKQTGKTQSGYVQALRQSNVKLMERMQRQTKQTEIFRRKYCEMYDRHRSIVEQNELLVAVLAQMRSTVRV